MTEPPKPQYTVVEREGRLVVEKAGEPAKGRLGKIPFPGLTPSNFDWLKTGQALLTRYYSPKLTDDGQAVMPASQLEPYIKLSARPDDLYYLTPRQQAIIGYLTALHRNGIIVFVVITAMAVIFESGVFLLAIALAIATATLTTYFKDEYEAIRQQLYVPATPPAPEGGPPLA
ncbi:MAG TPA: hypothetical protein VFV30_06805 [Novosphingobium sp.]|nr:hypothetical protein [Novosphingobium sp.]